MTFLQSPIMQDFAMPFLFVFAVTFGVLRISEVFKENTKVEALISVIIAAFAISNPGTLSFLKSIMPFAVLGMVAIFGIVFLWKIGKTMTEGEKMDWGVVAVLLMSGLLVLATPSVWEIIPNTRFFKRADVIFVAGLAIVAALFLFAHRSEGGPGNYEGMKYRPDSKDMK